MTNSEKHCYFGENRKKASGPVWPSMRKVNSISTMVVASSGRAGAATAPAIKLDPDDGESDASPEAARPPQHERADNADDAEEAEGEATTSPTDRVMELTAGQRDELSERGSLRFGAGCPVAYGFRRSRRDGRTIEVREGIVKSAFVNIDRRRFEYDIERPTAAAAANGGEPASDRAIERRVAYAIGCPVWIKPGASGGDEERVEARVLFAGPKVKNGEMSIEYIVQYSGGDNDGVLRMEEGVAADRVSCNKEAVGNINRQRIERRARGDDGGREGDGRQDPIAPNEDEQRPPPPPVVVPDASPNWSRGDPNTESPQKSHLRKNDDSSDGVGRALQSTERPAERGTAAEDRGEPGGRRATSRRGDRRPAADEGGVLARGEEPAPSIEGTALLRADDDGETSALTCELSDSPAGGRARGAGGVARRGSFDAAGAARAEADFRPPPGAARTEADTRPPPPAPSPVERRKINFQPPDPLRRQRSTASFEDAPAGKQGAEASVRTDAPFSKTPSETKTSADNSSSLPLGKQSKHGELFWCKMTVPLWVKYGAQDLFRK